MSVTTSTSPEQNHDGRPRQSGKRRSLVDSLAMPGLSDIDFDPPRVEIALRATFAVRDQ
ncbi:MAG: hypothetical protein NTAFB05_04550 [Nitrobacter sp.]|uniref:hypothetical protein n=1 Tax=Nitrobacter sp. TaxID=29420 RepID=UPI00387DF38E